MTTALICEMCGAPMKTRRECEYCNTLYYTGPEVPEFPQMPWNLSGFSSVSTCMVVTDTQIPTAVWR